MTGPWLMVRGPRGPEVYRVKGQNPPKLGPVYVSPAWLALALRPAPDELDERADALAAEDAARREWARR
jgi:hypothetical protein